MKVVPHGEEAAHIQKRRVSAIQVRRKTTETAHPFTKPPENTIDCGIYCRPVIDTLLEVRKILCHVRNRRWIVEERLL